MLSSKISCQCHTQLQPRSQLGSRRAAVVAPGLKENVQALPSIDGIKQVVVQPLGHTIPNQEGSLRRVPHPATHTVHLALHSYG